MTSLYSVLTEAGISVNRTDFILMSEATQIKVADDTLTTMMKFITDKYNSIDFSEIEKSAGDIRKFKYYKMILENADTLKTIYTNSEDPGAQKYVEVVDAIRSTMGLLETNHDELSTLYKGGNGVIQLLYTSLVAGCLYATGTLVSNTIRFVTTEQNTDCEVLFDEIPGTIKHVHIKNILAVKRDQESFGRLIRELSNQRPVSESVTVAGVSAVFLGVIGVFALVPRIIVLIREIIYSIYYARVKVSEMLELQENLLKTNIESLEAGRGNKKVVARQRKIAKTLEVWKNRIALKMDTTEQLKKVQQKKEDASMHIDRNSPFATDDASAVGILL